MNIKRLEMLVDYMWDRATADPADRAYMPMMIWGETGIGKSETVKSRAKSKGIDFVDLRLGALDVGDLIGNPRIQDVFPDPIALSKVKTSKLLPKRQLISYMAETYPEQFGDSSAAQIWSYLEKANKQFPQYHGEQKTVHALPDWFPEPNTKGILFLDELNRGQRDVMQAIFQLLLDRKMHMASLPRDWIVFAAINPPETAEGRTFGGVQFDVAEDAAFLNRFCHIALGPEVSEWLEFAKREGVEPTIRSLIAADPSAIGRIRAVDLPNAIEPSPRTWVLFGRICKPLIADVLVERYSAIESSDKQSILREVARGFLGTDAAQNWWRVALADIRPATAKEVFENWTEIRKVYQTVYEKNKASLHQLVRVTTENLVEAFQALDSGGGGLTNRTVLPDEVKASVLGKGGYLESLFDWGLSDELGRFLGLLHISSDNKEQAGDDKKKIPSYFFDFTENCSYKTLDWLEKKKSKSSNLSFDDLFIDPKFSKFGSVGGADVLPLLLSR